MNNNIPEFEGHSLELILKKCNYLKGTDGEGHAIAKLVERLVKNNDLLHSVSKCCDVCDAPLTNPPKYYNCSNCAEIVQGNDC